MPFDLSDRYATWKWKPVWSLDPDAPTYLLAREDERRFVKLGPAGRALPDEAQKLRWAGEHYAVPEVVEYGSDGETDWLMTAALPGVDATRHPWFTEDPRRLVVALGEGLRRFHETLPARECPFDFTVDTAVTHARARVVAGLVRPEEMRSAMGPPEAVRWLAANAPDSEQEVICHGDYCLPNVFLTGADVSGYLDVGGLAVADKWWDIAIGAWSCTWNLGEGYEDLFYEAYGVPADQDRIAWYRLLYDLR